MPKASKLLVVDWWPVEHVQPEVPSVPQMATPYKTLAGEPLPAVSYTDWYSLVEGLVRNDSISPLQIAEACGFSLAMVARFALGHSADGGLVTVVAADNLYGLVSLACARHLMNAGTSALVVLAYKGELSPEATSLIPAILNRGGEVVEWSGPSLPTEVCRLIELSHNVICGLANGSPAAQPQRESFVATMNELAVPVHAVGYPLGPDAVTETMESLPLYASSTLSLGLPLRPLSVNPDLVGRHYLCDLGLSPDAYTRAGYLGRPLFAEQPVIQLLHCGDAEECA